MKLKIKIMILLGMVASMLSSCLQGDQINTPPNGAGSIVSTAINSTGFWQITPLSVDASASEVQYDLVLVVLNSAKPAPQDIHVTFVEATDSLANYNAANGTNYVMPGGVGTPAFTLVDGGVATIPKGSSVGYLRIKTTSANYFGVTNYAFAYRISSVQETGYTVSTNNAYSIVPFIPKNPYDGVYDLNITTSGWAAYGISDNLPGDYGNVALSTTGLYSCVFLNLQAGGNLQPGFTANNAGITGFGATAPNFVFDANNKLVNVFNSVPDDGRSRTFSINPAALPSENVYDPVKKVITANYLFHQKSRPDCTVKMTLTYIGPR